MVDKNNQIMQSAPPGRAAVAHVSSKEFASKYRSKREIFNFLATDVGVYLPPYESTTIYFLKEIMGGQKRMIRTTKIR